MPKNFKKSILIYNGKISHTVSLKLNRKNWLLGNAQCMADSTTKTRFNLSNTVHNIQLKIVR